MADRYTKADAIKAFERLCRAMRWRIAKKYNDVGAYSLDWNSVYGGGIIHKIVNKGGGVSTPLGMHRMNAREFCDTVNFHIRLMETRRRRR